MQGGCEMTIQNRTIFLDHIAEQLNRPRKKEVVKPTWKNQPQWNVLNDATQEELVDVLKEQCNFIHTTYKHVGKKDLKQALSEAIAEFGGDSLIVANDKRNASYGLQAFYQSLDEDSVEVRYWETENQNENIRFAERANIGITFSDITIAESGTVTLFNHAGNGRSISLLPKHYIAIIPKSTIVPRMSQATKQIQEMKEQGIQLPSCISFISGPSNSADIELNLIVGVHGPVSATYIIIDDDPLN